MAMLQIAISLILLLDENIYNLFVGFYLKKMLQGTQFMH